MTFSPPGPSLHGDLKISRPLGEHKGSSKAKIGPLSGLSGSGDRRDKPLRVDGIQGRDQVGPEILDRFQADGYAQQALGDAAIKACLGLQAMIGVRLNRHTRDSVESFRSLALAIPEVIAVYHITGNQDFLVHVAVRDADHLRDLALEAFTTRPEVANLETSLIFQGDRKSGFPIALQDRDGER